MIPIILYFKGSAVLYYGRKIPSLILRVMVMEAGTKDLNFGVHLSLKQCAHLQAKQKCNLLIPLILTNLFEVKYWSSEVLISQGF